MEEVLRPTISNYFARLLIDQARQSGLSESDLLQESRLSPQLLAHPDTRISPSQLGALMRAIWRASDDELSGMAAKSHPFGMFALMARHTTHCSDLREALHYSVQFYKLLSPVFSWELEEGASRVSLQIRLQEPHPSHFVEEFMLLVWHRYFNWLIGARMPLLGTEFAYARPAHAAEHLLMFPGPVTYNGSCNRILFEQKFMSQPVVRNRSDLRRYLQHLPDEWFIKQVFAHSLADRIYHALMEAQAGTLPEMGELAQRWHTTTRTLHRHLGREQASFRKIRDQVRRDKAIYWLLEDRCTVGEIAHRLVMSEPAFSRAFKSWTGLTPLVYRRTRSVP